MNFKLYAKNELLGTSALEAGDPPMGVAFGELIPTEAYSKYKSIFERQDFEAVEKLGLSVVSESGIKLEPCVGIGIEDYSAELGELSIQVNVLGLHNKIYSELFPKHIAAYENQFK